MQLVVHLTSDHDADVVTGRLWVAGAAGIEERPKMLVATFASAALADAAAAALSDLEPQLRQPPPTEATQRWRAFAQPLWVADDTVVVPAWWDGPVPAAALTVTVDPGSAFGFGNHPTTTELAARLRRRSGDGFGPSGSSSVLDLGCGSGLLSVIAAGSGARSVVSVDIDPEARAATRSNVDSNDVGDRVVVAGATIDDAEECGPFDLILANVPVGVHEETATTAGRLLAPKGQVWATGVTGDQVDRVIDAHEGAGMGLAPAESIDLDGEWWLIVLTAP